MEEQDNISSNYFMPIKNSRLDDIYSLFPHVSPWQIDVVSSIRCSNYGIALDQIKTSVDSYNEEDKNRFISEEVEPLYKFLLDDMIEKEEENAVNLVRVLLEFQEIYQDNLTIGKIIDIFNENGYKVIKK